MECVVTEIDVSSVHWFLIICISTETVFLSVCQVLLDDAGSGNVASLLRGFELRQLSTGRTQPSYGVESLNEMAING